MLASPGNAAITSNSRSCDQGTITITHQKGQQLIAPCSSSPGFATNWNLQTSCLCWSSCRALLAAIMNTPCSIAFLCWHPSFLQAASTSPRPRFIHMDEQTHGDATELTAAGSACSPLTDCRASQLIYLLLIQVPWASLAAQDPHLNPGCAFIVLCLSC